jgi:hypothetical protein
LRGRYSDSKRAQRSATVGAARLATISPSGSPPRSICRFSSAASVRAAPVFQSGLAFLLLPQPQPVHLFQELLEKPAAFRPHTLLELVHDLLGRAWTLESARRAGLPFDNARERHHAGEIGLRMFLGDHVEYLAAVLAPVVLQVGEELGRQGLQRQGGATMWRTIPRSDARYALVAFDADGAERLDDRDGAGAPFSDRVIGELTAAPKTDIFLFSHGWKGDVVAAVDQYDRWIGALHARTADQVALAAKRPGYTPCYIGLHWPSLPFGDEEIGAGVSFAPAGASSVDGMVDTYAKRLGDTLAVRAQLAIIFDEARQHAAADSLTPRSREAYIRLDRALNLGNSKPGDATGDRAPFDPDRAADNSAQVAAFGGDGGLGGLLLSPLRQLSFWTMKSRARTVGEMGVHPFVKRLQVAAPSARVHLMGHSFGCAVMSAVLGGPGADSPLARPVDSCVLVQGAISLWSYSPDIPVKKGTPGYFHRVLAQRKVRGPFLVTTSRHDTAVGRLYPLAAGVANQVAFAPGEWPEFGALGAFGARGLEDVQDAKMFPANEAYGFAPGRVYVLESSEFICKGDGPSGAHSDIDGPEVAHAILQAAMI